MDTEKERLGALQQLKILDTADEAAYDDLTRMAASRLQAATALVVLVDEERQWFKSRIGLQLRETPREHAFCTHAIERPGEVMLVEDASKDPRFADNPLVTGEPHIRFYLGAPLVTSDGHAVGTLCVFDPEPRSADASDVEELRFLADQVIQTMEAQQRSRGDA